MHKRIPESELILNDKGRIYHLNLHPEMVADTIIVVGDPERVPKVSSYFDKVEFQVNNRELVTHTGTIGSKRISVISSGMGTDNVELLMIELDALVNVDFESRKVKENLRQLEIFRIGTSGCLQPDIPLDAYLVSKAGLGLDTLMNFYEWDWEKAADEYTTKVQLALTLPFQPYFSKGDESLLALFSEELHEGITITCPGFYAPQGREIRLKPRIDDMLGALAEMITPIGRYTNFEMETAGYYALAELLGHKMVSLNVLIANRATQQFSSHHEEAVDGLIKLVLEKIC